MDKRGFFRVTDPTDALGAPGPESKMFSQCSDKIQDSSKKALKSAGKDTKGLFSRASRAVKLVGSP